MEKVKVVREFRIPPFITLVKVTYWGGTSLIYAVRDFAKFYATRSDLKNYYKDREPEVMDMPLLRREDGLFEPANKNIPPTEEMKPFILEAANNGSATQKLEGEYAFRTEYERVEFEQDEMRLFNFTYNVSGANWSNAGCSLILKQNGRWIPVDAGLSCFSVEEIRADGMFCPDDGYESLEQYMEELKRVEPNVVISDAHYSNE